MFNSRSKRVKEDLRKFDDSIVVYGVTYNQSKLKTMHGKGLMHFKIVPLNDYQAKNNWPTEGCMNVIYGDQKHCTEENWLGYVSASDVKKFKLKKYEKILGKVDRQDINGATYDLILVK